MIIAISYLAGASVNLKLYRDRPLERGADSAFLERTSITKVAQGLLLCVAMIALWADLASAQPAGASSQPPAVTVAVVREREVNPPRSFVGRVEAVQAVDLRPRVEGVLQQQLFKEGGDVKSGDLLYVIEPDRYEAALAVAEASQAKAEASLKEAKLTLERNEKLIKDGTVSQAEYDAALAQADSAAADVRAAEAAVLSATLDLRDTRIVAPIDGRIGRSAVTVGNLVGPDSGTLARIMQLDPIRVVYSVNENRLLKNKRILTGLTEEERGKTFVPAIRLPDGTVYEFDGRVDFVDNQVDASTGTVAIRALFPNPNADLLPGQYVKLVVRRDRAELLPVVPQSAVLLDREGSYVFVIDDNNRAVQRRIETGTAIDVYWSVNNGLQVGETIVAQGIQKVNPGQLVEPVFEPVLDEAADPDSP